MNYWEKRQRQINGQLEKDEKKLKRKLSSYYDAESRKMEKEISAFYQQYGKDNIIEYRILMQTISEEDKNLLLKQMNDFASKYPQYEHLLPIRESIYKLNRLEGLQQSILIQQYEMGAVDEETVRGHLEKQALRGANAMAEELGFGENFYSVNPDIITKLINQKWASGNNFSDDIWKNRQKLADYLNSDFAAGIARGDSYEKLMHNLRKRFGRVSRRDMYRLIYTEGTFAINEGMITPFEQDFEEYRFSTVGDGKVCSECSAIHGKKFSIKERNPGVNFPPLHPWCRCSFVVEILDNFMEEYERKHGGKAPSKVLQDSRKTGKMKLKTDNYSTFIEMQNYFKDNWNVNVDTTIGNLDFSAVQASSKGIVRILHEFPQAQGVLKNIGIKKSGVMCADFNGRINFNPDYYDDIAKLKDMIQGNVAGFHPKNTGLLETGSHEMGHLLERALIDKSNFNQTDTAKIFSWNNSTEAKRVVFEACRAAKKTTEGKGLKNVELVEQVSRYAKKDRSETLAECVGDYIANGDNAAVLSKELWKILKRELG